MSVLLKITGGLWAALGLGNILLSPAFREPEGSFGTVVLIFNFVAFILPGLAVYGIGAMIARGNRPPQADASGLTEAYDDAEPTQARQGLPDGKKPKLAGGAQEIIADVEVRGESQNNPDGKSRQKIIAKLIEKDDYVTLVREPDNIHDSNAIRIDSRLGTIGYIARERARTIAPVIDSHAHRAHIRAIFGGDEGKSYGVSLDIEIGAKLDG